MYNGWARIVGIVASIRGTTLEEESRPAVYYAFAQVPIPMIRNAAILVRSATPAGAAIRDLVRRTNGAVPVYDVKSLEERMGESLGFRRVVTAMLFVFGAISLLLATIGLYSVISQVVSERTREIGIRIAVGARPSQILSQFMRHGARSGLLGLAFGFVVAAYAQRWLAGMLYEIKPYDAVTFCASGAGVVSLLLLAVWWPARRASRIDPQQALRYE